ncbi:hypothetical protein [Pseudonocardia cypriaca]|uniref:Uncharacterized protein n=1 Tax=Pseudonocardia cypriaca TaxID=882449 RepID=A0A543GGK0_9PSEU|nr:hypothetical protein [Pseudonocardia cypriaca]TQM45196.1 hypothetical protein FB388_2593 [Pseudonocardia cypriaca]
MTTPAGGTLTRSPQLRTALVCSGIVTLALTALALFMAGLGLLVLGSASAADRGIAIGALVIAVVFVAPPVVLMWVALVRLISRPPAGARLMIGCLRVFGGFLLVVALPTLSRSESFAVIGGLVGIAGGLIAVAQLVSSATRTTT